MQSTPAWSVAGMVAYIVHGLADFSLQKSRSGVRSYSVVIKGVPLDNSRQEEWNDAMSKSGCMYVYQFFKVCMYCTIFCVDMSIQT